MEEFRETIDSSHKPTDSVILRYRHAVRMESDDERDAGLKELLERTSIREGLRICPLLRHRGVDVDVLDETSLTHTRTLKSLDGCVSTAQCLLRGDRQVVFESGGNTGVALTAYGARAGLETFLFVPAENLPLLHGEAFDRDTAHVFAVDDPRLVKEAAKAFATRSGRPRIPELGWRLQASTFVGCFLAEELQAAAPYDWLAQSISAGFGPLGVYRVLGPLAREVGGLPRFLGVQQSANCAMARALDGGGRPADASVESTAKLLARVMYDGDPTSHGTVEPLRRILADTRGRMTTIDRDEFDRAISETRVLDQLESSGVRITRNSEGEVLEKTGLMALAAVLGEIEAGGIPAGSRVLVCLTGGTAPATGRVAASRWEDEAAKRPHELASPDMIVGADHG